MHSFERPANHDSVSSKDIESKSEQPPHFERFVSLSDIHNDVSAARASLMQRQIIDKNGEWRKDVGPVHIVITGDSINKESPDWGPFKFLKNLRDTAPEGCKVTLLVGNHEIALLSGIAIAEKKKVDSYKKYIELLSGFRVIHKQGPILFLHRYPSLALVQELAEQYQSARGDVAPDEWHINKRFQEAMSLLSSDPSRSRELLRLCDDGKQPLEGLSVQDYYKKYGAIIGELLESIGVTTVVHGHKKNVTGGQQFEEYIPNIFMINNDAGISSTKNPQHNHRTGSVDITPGSDGLVEITCSYKKNNNHNGHVKVQKAEVPAHPNGTSGNGS